MNALPRFRSFLALNWKLGGRPLIVSAGMPRSGSTLLFNILRILLKNKWPGLASGWCDDISRIQRGDAYLLKTHAIGPFFRWRARHSFYTYRDIRVAAVSNLRKFGHAPSIGQMRWKVNQYLIAKQYCDLIIRYEDLVTATPSVIAGLAKILAVDVDAELIHGEVVGIGTRAKNDSVGPSEETLLHGDHRTGTKDDEWRDVLPEELTSQVNKEFAWWFQECGYPSA